ncbi:hypothetical protein WOLCODRAFT_160234 [Wolfiporia cocos MD-104 SS10]|uniref:Uncharacterized protein n=1 Tax=Wolfiporia cocos (strain MD-104) TaxID=742152 RepID=A0A2H3J4H7_WOLCO|nr:hypothetical protein WOLCODRAFT_160234 [Wolfiporia cocos MD-104 SS10]
MHLVLSQIDTIKFAADWKRRGEDTGGKKRIGQFFRRAFQTDPAHASLFNGLDAQEREEKMSELSSSFRKWRKDGEHTVTARNRLLRMYATFGVAVLLDPTWDVRNIVKRRSKQFGTLLDNLISDFDHTKATDSRIQACMAFLRIVSVLGGAGVRDHVTDFLTTSPPACATRG